MWIFKNSFFQKSPVWAIPFPWEVLLIHNKHYAKSRSASTTNVQWPLTLFFPVCLCQAPLHIPWDQPGSGPWSLAGVHKGGWALPGQEDHWSQPSWPGVLHTLHWHLGLCLAGPTQAHHARLQNWLHPHAMCGADVDSTDRQTSHPSPQVSVSCFQTPETQDFCHWFLRL